MDFSQERQESSIPEVLNVLNVLSPKVTSIIAIDPYSRTERVIFTRG